MIRTKTGHAVFGALIALGASSQAQAALYGFGPAEGWTMGQISAQVAEVTGNIAAFGASFASQMNSKFEQIISAVAVATSQEAMSAGTVTDGARVAASQLVNAVLAQRKSSQSAQAYLSFNPATGQGYDPCGTLAKNQTLTQAFESVAQVANNTMTALDIGPGRVFESTADAMQGRLRDHLKKFCTAAEAQAGLCTVSELPGGDLNAALLFESASADSLKAQARRAYIQHVVGAPVSVPEVVKGNVGQQMADPIALNVARQSSMMSIPAYSLAMIDAANTQSPEYGGKSPNEVLTLRVNQYFGGAEAQEWAGSMARQTERGLLVEHAKMAGLQAWVRQREYVQNQRIEANLAALVVLSAKEAREDLAEQHHLISKGVIRHDIQ